ncbi:patatin-like phospholipase family protein [Cytobacillus sp. S13-E01]|uniref:patatin-like phospholipase family protein n=1 Tax=Cytobacillus sp. S13-E01 TaxID=3031326 RepID=UPI0023D8C253|nr:patatin-like phospholipase family protein [Cytobacillus sp. S13-E01]MDF0727324.1 patatin-like phospholipase family protein [Cytobacillus sp. S13-E01]
MYIDGVLSGGGIKGFALIGAYKALEEKGFQFKRLAGTSAGSIIAAFIAAGYTSTEIIKMMDEVDVSDFLDERKTILPFPVAKWILLYWRLGLYKGVALEKWISKKLSDKGVKTFSDLPPQSLRLIASDLTNGKMLVLPDDLKTYGITPEIFSVARAVRMSCSLPYFFEPVRLRTLNDQNLVVDGGVLSNFPIWLFDEEKATLKRPVLGIKLSGSDAEKKKNKINNAIELYGALFETMKNAHDARYISRSLEKNIIFIPLDSGLTTEFNLTEENKLALIEFGQDRAQQFLKTWTF